METVCCVLYIAYDLVVQPLAYLHVHSTCPSHVRYHAAWSRLGQIVAIAIIIGLGSENEN